MRNELALSSQHHRVIFHFGTGKLFISLIDPTKPFDQPRFSFGNLRPLPKPEETRKNVFACDDVKLFERAPGETAKLVERGSGSINVSEGSTAQIRCSGVNFTLPKPNEVKVINKRSVQFVGSIDGESPERLKILVVEFPSETSAGDFVRKVSGGA